MLLTCLLTLLLAAPPHPDSFSSSRVTVTGAAARLELRCQSESLMEAFGPGIDLDGDGWLGDDELIALRDPLFAYVAEHYVLRAGSGGSGTAGTVLAGAPVSLSGSEPEFDVAWPTQWIDLAVEYRADELIPDLLIDVTLFRATAPDHRDHCVLVWNGGEPLETLFWMGEYRRHYSPDAPPESQVLRGWVIMGVAHILTGWDHIAFVLVLIMAAGSVRALLLVVTAFTLAHSVTLALAALQVVDAGGLPVELVIALSIAWVGAVTLFARRPRARWLEAFLFGLVHGLGFAGFLGESLYGEPRPLRALVGFNLGVEAGQLLVVAVAIAVLALLRVVIRRLAPARIAPGSHAAPASPASAEPHGSLESDASHSERSGTRAPDEAWLAPRFVRVPACAGVVLLSLYWASQRTGWHG